MTLVSPSAAQMINAGRSCCGGWWLAEWASFKLHRLMRQRVEEGAIGGPQLRGSRQQALRLPLCAASCILKRRLHRLGAVRDTLGLGRTVSPRIAVMLRIEIAPRDRGAQTPLVASCCSVRLLIFGIHPPNFQLSRAC